MNEKQEKQTYNRKEAASYIGVSVITLDRATANRKISCFRVGRRILFSQEHLDSFLQKSESKAKK